MSDPSLLERVPTGISGLDTVLDGGLPRSGVYIVHGHPGAGKTILGNQVCYHRARSGEQVMYVTLLAESHERMLAHLQGMAFFDPTLLADRLHYLSAFKILEQEGLTGLMRVLRGEVMAREATLLVLDGLVTAEEVSLSRRAADSSLAAIAYEAGRAQEFKKFIHELQAVASMTGCTMLLLGSTERPRAFHPAYTMVDGIIELLDEATTLRPVRHLEVRKMRGVAHLVGKHAYELSTAGMVVRPRLETNLLRRTQAEGEVTPGTRRLAFGVDGLDAMLGGGVPENSVTMLLGSPGSGKTTLGLQFLAEGARRGEPGLLFSFYERPAAIVRKSERLGLGIEAGLRAGLLDLVWQPPVESELDMVIGRLLAEVKRTKARRLFLDGMEGFHMALDQHQDRLRAVMTALTDELERLGVTTMYTSETREIVGPQVAVPIQGVSAATQNIMLLRHVEIRSCVRLVLSIVKVRDSKHDRALKELNITDSGILVQDLPADVDVTLTGARPRSDTGAAPLPSGAKS